jgi:hypothetical protein
MSFGGLLKSLGPMAPLLGLTLGAGLGGQSKTGSILGAGAGLLGGLVGGAFLGSSTAIGAIFGLANAPIIGSAGSAIAGLLGLGSFAAGIAAAGILAAPLIVGAVLLARNAARRSRRDDSKRGFKKHWHGDLVLNRPRTTRRGLTQPGSE